MCRWNLCEHGRKRCLASHGEEVVVCGWLKDKFGVSWQVVPAVLNEMLRDGDPEKVARVTQAFLRMKKFDVNELRKAYRGTLTKVT